MDQKGGSGALFADPFQGAMSSTRAVLESTPVHLPTFFVAPPFARLHIYAEPLEYPVDELVWITYHPPRWTYTTMIMELCGRQKVVQRKMVLLWVDSSCGLSDWF